VFWSRIFAASAAIALVVVGFFGWNLRRANTSLEQSTQEAKANLITARQNLWSSLAALAKAELGQRPLEAAKLALAAWPRDAAMGIPKRDVTLNVIWRSLASLHERRRIAAGAEVSSVAFSPDGKSVLRSQAKSSSFWISYCWFFDRACGPHGHRPRQGPAVFVGPASAKDTALIVAPIAER
jgi:hypothetical protein